MKRFLLFAGDIYYPKQFAGDFVGAFATKAEARSAGDAMERKSYYWMSIHELTETGELIVLETTDSRDGAEWLPGKSK